jgi:hypothetical protein
MGRSGVRLATLSFAALALLAACGGAPAASIPPLPSIAVPSISLPSIALPSFALPSGITLPSIALPSFAPDPVIEGVFPAEIGGQPVTDVESANFLTVLQAMGMDPETVGEFVSGMQAISIDPAAVGFGSGTVVLDDTLVAIQVVRFPGGNAGAALDTLTRIDAPDEAPTLTNETIGGKAATVATNPDGDVEYFYVSGEWAWIVDNADREHVETIFAGLP